MTADDLARLEVVVAEERRLQGLPTTVEDAATLGKVAGMLAAAGGGRDAAAAP